MRFFACLFILNFSPTVFAHVSTSASKPEPILAPLHMLEKLAIPILEKSAYINVGLALASPEQQQELIAFSHSENRCGGFEKLTQEELGLAAHSLIQQLEKKVRREENRASGPWRPMQLEENADLKEALDQVSAERIKQTVEWLSAFPTRYNKSRDANKAILAMKERIEGILKSSSTRYKVDLVTHRSTPQKSIRVRIEGQTRPTEIVVIGGHIDSIVGWGDSAKAPGADDNASGSASVLEAMSLLVNMAPTARTLEFFWYAGEESGLLGSAEIAHDYKNRNQDVVGVLQLDMTAYPGMGRGKIGNTADFTSASLREMFQQLNKLYLGATLVRDECGYACSDHASWFRQGYATLMPFEATMDTMNPGIHSINDVVGNKLDFDHSTLFAKLAVAFAWELGNSEFRP